MPEVDHWYGSSFQSVKNNTLYQWSTSGKSIEHDLNPQNFFRPKSSQRSKFVKIFDNMFTCTCNECLKRWNAFRSHINGHPIAGVALTGMFGYEVITTKDCSGFICMPSLPSYKSTSEAGQVLGRTDANGSLVVAPKQWSTDKKSARNLKVLFFTNATFDVTCNEDGEEKFKGFIDLLPQWVNGKLTEREFDCSNLEFKKDAEKTIEFKCTSIKTMEQIQAEVDKIKSTCVKHEISNDPLTEEQTLTEEEQN